MKYNVNEMRSDLPLKVLIKFRKHYFETNFQPLLFSCVCFFFYIFLLQEKINLPIQLFTIYRRLKVATAPSSQVQRRVPLLYVSSSLLNIFFIYLFMSDFYFDKGRRASRILVIDIAQSKGISILPFWLDCFQSQNIRQNGIYGIKTTLLLISDVNFVP